MSAQNDPQHLAGRLSADRLLRIVFATDGSADAEGAGTFLRRLPLPDGTAIRVVTVTPGGWRPHAEGRDQAVRAWAERTTRASVVALSREGVAVTAESCSGAPAAEIVHAAERFDAELVVLGSRGLTGLQGFLLGSVARNVAHSARRPVLIARPCHNELRRVIVAVDSSRHSEEAVRLTAAFPLPEHTELVVCHVSHWYDPCVVDPIELEPLREALIQETERERHALIERITTRASDLLRESRHPVRVALREGDPASELLRIAAESGADLIVAGARGASPLPGLAVGSVADRLLKAAHCSVLLVHEGVPR